MTPSRFLAGIFLTGTLALHAQAALRTLDEARYHLRSGTEQEWQEFVGKTPQGQRLDIRFAAQTNRTEFTLLLRQSDVKLDWNVALNGSRIGKLFLMEAPLVNALPMPPGALRTGENTLSITPPRANDDILAGDFKVIDRPLGKALGATLNVRVTDTDSQSALPCRITIADDQGALAMLHASAGQQLAARPGVVYTPDGKARFAVLPGRYTLYASRGFEYSLTTQSVAGRRPDFSGRNAHPPRGSDARPDQLRHACPHVHVCEAR